MHTPTTTTPTKIIGITRVSGDHQDLARQRVALIGMGLTPDQWVEVENVSGSDLADTPEWRNRILPAIQAGADVAADAIDRIVRADGFDLRCFRAVYESNGKIHTPGKVFDTCNPDDVMVATFLAGIGGREKRELVRRAQAGKEVRRGLGLWAHRLDCTPIGTSFDRSTGRWGTNSKTRDVIDAFEAVANGGSYAQASKHMGLSTNGARVVLTNPIYKGILTYDQTSGAKYPSKDGRQPRRKKVPREASKVIQVRVYGLEGQCPQIVSDALWEQVQARIRGITESRRKTRASVVDGMVYSGYIVPAEIRTYTGQQTFSMDETDTDRLHVYYGLSARNRTGGPVTIRYACRCMLDKQGRLPVRCGASRLRADVTNACVDEYLRRMTCTPEVLEAIKADLAAKQSAPDGREAEVTRLQKQVRDLEGKAKRLTDLFVDGMVSRQDHDARRQVLLTALQQAQECLQKASSAPVAPTAHDLDTMASGWRYDPAWGTTRKRAWLARHVPVVRVDRWGVRGLVIRLPCPSEGLAGPWVWSGSPLGPLSWEQLLDLGQAHQVDVVLT